MLSQNQTVIQNSRERKEYVPSFFVAFVFCIVASLVFSLSNNRLQIEFLLILTLSGSLALSDFLDVLRGKRDIFSMRSLVSVVMFHTTYVAPVLHIWVEYYPSFLVLPLSMSEAFMDHAILQFFCVLGYFTFVRVFLKRKEEARDGTSGFPIANDPSRPVIAKWLRTAGTLSFIIFLYTVVEAGGPLTWLSAQFDYRNDLTTSGWLITLAEAFPSLFFMSYVAGLSKSLSRRALLQRVFLAFVVFVIVTFITSGLRGSRANLVWPTLSALAVIHILFFRVKLRLFAVFAILGVIFAGVYDVYKKSGLDGLQVVQEQGLDAHSADSQYTFGLESVLLGDFSRAAIQAILLDRWNSAGFKPYLGATYLGDTLLFIPGTEASMTVPHKSLAATDILYGAGAAKYTDEVATRIYGLQGEALINFGPIGAVLIFIPFAYIVARTERLHGKAVMLQSARHVILYATLVPVILLLYLSDFDNVLRNLTSNALLPFIALFVGTLVFKRRMKTAENKHAVKKDRKA